MEETLMALVLLWNLPKGLHVAPEVVEVEVEVVVLVNILEEGPLLALVAALIVVLMAIGLETAVPGIGKTSVIAVEKGAI